MGFFGREIQPSSIFKWSHDIPPQYMLLEMGYMGAYKPPLYRHTRFMLSPCSFGQESYSVCMLYKYVISAYCKNCLFAHFCTLGVLKQECNCIIWYVLVCLVHPRSSDVGHCNCSITIIIQDG